MKTNFEFSLPKTIPSLEVPKRLEEKRGMLGGLEHTWFEYIPESYDSTSSVPLVIVLHGGGRDGATCASHTTWSLLAEKEKFIAIYPDASNMIIENDGTKFGEWNAFFMKGTKNDDLLFLRELIAYMKEAYNIDASRIYMTGQSNGDQMVSHFAFEHGDLLAAAAGTSGPTRKEMMKNKQGESIQPAHILPFYRWHGEHDDKGGNSTIHRQQLDRQNNNDWIQRNGCHKVPKLLIDGRYNTEIYEGGEAEFRFTEFVGGLHSLDLSASSIIWYTFFSRFSRNENGEIVTLKQVHEENKPGVALVSGVSKALVHGKRVFIDPETQDILLKINGQIMVPLVFLQTAFQATVHWDESSQQATITYKNKTGILKSHYPLLIVNKYDYFQLAVNPLIIKGKLMVPLADMIQHLFGKRMITSGDAVYISNELDLIDHYTEEMLTTILKK